MVAHNKAVGHREIWASSDVAARPPEAELAPSKDGNTGELTFVTGPHTMGIIEDQRGDEQEVEEEEDEEEEVASSENEENEAGVAALLPTPGSQRGIVAKVNENLLIRSSGGGGDDDDASNSAVSSHASFSSVAAAASSSSSTTSSTSASSSSSSSSPSSSSLSRHARFLDYDHPSPSDNSCDSHHVRRLVDPAFASFNLLLPALSPKHAKQPPTRFNTPFSGKRI
ncbi:unnamed protein product [Schistocephalus solidus]|uniref:Uncharacterized protein n=1 Tax=Schistocephalus solidus TaxID=70667 RepID=A0A183T6K4_SCHSO|nr:unnamed protein product [Schistocephalus solidus]